MEISSETNTYYSYIVHRRESNDTDCNAKPQSEHVKKSDVKPGPSHIPRPVKYATKKPTAQINRNINRNIIFINEDDEGISNRTSKRPSNKRKLPSLHKFEFYTNIDSDESSSKFFSFGPKSTTTDNETKIEQPRFTNKDIYSPQYAEKTTYCRPVLNLYNQEFIYKTMERNARLQKLAKKLVHAREKEKQREAWNNYINELKNKHRYAEVSYIPNYEQDENPDIIDYYNTKFSWQQSNPCHNLLNDFYDTINEPNSNDYAQRPTNYRPYIFENNRYCYPTSSHGRLLALNREKQNNRYKKWEYHEPNRYYRENTIIMDSDYETTTASKQRYGSIRTPIIKRRFPVNKEVNTNIRSLSVQTDFTNIFNYETDRENQSVKDKYNTVSNNVMRLKQKIMQNKSSEKINTLNKIEYKIDILLDSFNTFLSEIKSKKLLSTELKSRAVSCDSFDSYKTSFQPKDDHVKFLKDQILCGVIQEKPSNSMGFHVKTPHTIEDILFEEMNKSDQVKKDIEEMLTKTDHSCSVHIAFDIPTKERSTEVTDSFSKTLNNPKVNFQVFAPKDDRKMTIAVNTDPLGILALIRVSGDTLKQLLSFMPQIDYYSYLSRLQFPQPRTISTFVCNICGAAFNKPSLLSNHIQTHNLGKSRDCCVCRHILDMKQYCSALFKCQHCGQRFTRAYCKELHEQDCGIRLGRPKNRTPSLVLLS